MQPGYIYALKNKSFGDYTIKIGMTTREPHTRAKEIYVGASGVPEPFDLAFACQVSDCTEAQIIYNNDSSGIMWASLDMFMRSPPLTSLLSNQQKERIEIISDIFRNVFPDYLIEDWTIDFSRDHNPQSEIIIWENIAKAFLKIEQVKYLSKEQKKEALYLLLLRSMMSASQVIERVKLKSLCKRVAKEILRGYEASPKPIRVK